MSVNAVEPFNLDKGANVAEAYDLVAPAYDSLWSSSLAYAENRWVFESLWHGGHLAGRVLDVGCGTGLLLDWMKKWIPPSSYLGVDLSRGMITEARRKHPDYQFLQFDVEAAPDAAWQALGAFDSVLALFTVPAHLRTADAVLARCHARLQPRGRIAWMPFGLGELEREPSYRVHDSFGRECVPLHATHDTLREALRAFRNVHVAALTSTPFLFKHRDSRSPLDYEPMWREFLRDVGRLWSQGANAEPMYLLGTGVK